MGFLGEAIKKYFEDKKFFVLGLDKKKNLNENIKNYNIRKIVEKNQINLIIDAIGYSGHNLDRKKLLKRSLQENLHDKNKLLKFLTKINQKILYVSFGTLYKYGKKRKIKRQYYKLFNNSNEKQTQIKSKYEKKLFEIKNKNLRILTVNLGSVYGNKKNLNFLDKNLIDIIIEKIKNKLKMDLYIADNKRIKNIIDINTFCSETFKIILNNYLFQKKKYKEVNLDSYLFDLVKLRRFKNLNFINTNKSIALNFYYVKNKKSIGLNKFLKSI